MEVSSCVQHYTMWSSYNTANHMPITPILLKDEIIGIYSEGYGI